MSAGETVREKLYILAYSTLSDLNMFAQCLKLIIVNKCVHIFKQTYSTKLLWDRANSSINLIYFFRSINLVWKLGVLWVLKFHQMVARSTGLKVSYPEFLFNYTHIFLYLKSHQLSLESVFISYSCTL